MRPWARAKMFGERIADDAFRRRVPGAFGVRLVGKHAQHAGVRRSARSRAKSAGWQSIGVWSNLKSPVWKTFPSGVRIASEQAPAKLWLMWMNSASSDPYCTCVARLDGLKSRDRENSDRASSRGSARA